MDTNETTNVHTRYGPPGRDPAERPKGAKPWLLTEAMPSAWVPLYANADPSGLEDDTDWPLEMAEEAEARYAAEGYAFSGTACAPSGGWEPTDADGNTPPTRRAIRRHVRGRIRKARDRHLDERGRARERPRRRQAAVPGRGAPNTCSTQPGRTPSGCPHAGGAWSSTAHGRSGTSTTTTRRNTGEQHAPARCSPGCTATAGRRCGGSGTVTSNATSSSTGTRAS